MPPALIRLNLPHSSLPRPATRPQARALSRRLAALALGVVLGAASLTPTPATAQEQAVFDLSIRGISAGQLRFSGTQDGPGYAVTGRLQSGGLLGAVKTLRYDATARGRVANGRYVPSSYAEKADTGRRQSESVMAYKAGVPQVTTYNPPRKARSYDVDPASQGGTVDPLTALFATLRAVDPAEACGRTLNMFDGRRVTRLTLGKPATAAQGVTCAGEYRRIDGFSDSEMAEKTRFPFTLTYGPAGGGKLHVTEIATDTIYGRASLKRR